MSIRKFGRKIQRLACTSTYDDGKRMFDELRKKFITSADDSTFVSSDTQHDGENETFMVNDASVCGSDVLQSLVDKSSGTMEEHVQQDKEYVDALTLCSETSSEDCLDLDLMQNITFRKIKTKLVVEDPMSLRSPRFKFEDIPKTQTNEDKPRKGCLRRVCFSDMPRGVKKIGEATFSEVFVHNSLVYKIVPLGDLPDQTVLSEFLREVRIFEIISGEEGVCKLEDAFIAVGRYGEEYLKAWDDYGFEENERPCKYGEEQEYGILVMEEGGVSLEEAKFNSLAEVDRFIRDLIKTLANLEHKYEFEHRDLHWGNILIKDGKVNLIDFSLSRLRDGYETIFNDLNDKKWLFEGDKDVDIQFDVYRRMLELSSGRWSSFTPATNVLWLEYVISKAFDKNRFKGKKALVAMYRSVTENSTSVSDIERKLFRQNISK